MVLPLDHVISEAFEIIFEQIHYLDVVELLIARFVVPKEALLNVWANNLQNIVRVVDVSFQAASEITRNILSFESKLFNSRYSGCLLAKQVGASLKLVALAYFQFGLQAYFAVEVGNRCITAISWVCFGMLEHFFEKNRRH